MIGGRVDQVRSVYIPGFFSSKIAREFQVVLDVVFLDFGKASAQGSCSMFWRGGTDDAKKNKNAKVYMRFVFVRKHPAWSLPVFFLFCFVSQGLMLPETTNQVDSTNHLYFL